MINHIFKITILKLNNNKKYINQAVKLIENLKHNRQFSKNK